MTIDFTKTADDFSNDIKEAFKLCTVNIPGIDNPNIKAINFEIFEEVLQNLLETTYARGQLKSLQTLSSELNIK